MGHVGAQVIKDDSPQDNPDHIIATTKPADAATVTAVLAADPALRDGMTRSEFLWIRLTNGDLILGVFPQDDLYFMFEEVYP